MKIKEVSPDGRSCVVELTDEDVGWLVVELPPSDGAYVDWMRLDQEMVKNRRNYFEACPTCGRDDPEVRILIETCPDEWHRQVIV